MSPQELQQGIDRLTKRLGDVEALDPTAVIEQHNIPHIEALAASVDEALVRTFGADTLDYKRYSDAAYFDNGPFNYAFPVPISQVHASLARSKARSLALLGQAISTLKERLAEFEAMPPRCRFLKIEKTLSAKFLLCTVMMKVPVKQSPAFWSRLDLKRSFCTNKRIKGALSSRKSKLMGTWGLSSCF